MVLRNKARSLVRSELDLPMPEWMRTMQILLCLMTCCTVLACLPLPQKLQDQFGINIYQAALQALAYLDAITRHAYFMVGMYLGVLFCL
jgi:hypothetical protein